MKCYTFALAQARRIYGVCTLFNSLIRLKDILFSSFTQVNLDNKPLVSIRQMQE